MHWGVTEISLSANLLLQLATPRVKDLPKEFPSNPIDPCTKNNNNNDNDNNDNNNNDNNNNKSIKTAKKVIR